MKRLQLIITTSLMLIVVFSVSTVAFAGGDTAYYPPIEITQEQESTKSITPDGNLTLVDDITTNDTQDKQFITAVTKNGNYFYLVIDRADNKDNVYLLNMVDEADLMALMEGKTVKIEEKPEQEEPTEPIPITTEPIQTEKPKNNTLPLLILVLAICGGGVFYYLKFVKNKQGNKGGTDLNEFDEEEFDDDDDEVYEVEDE